MKKSGSPVNDLHVHMKAISCYHAGCTPPPKPMMLGSAAPHSQLWSDAQTWANFTNDGFPPADGDNLTIPIGQIYLQHAVVLTC